VKVLFVASECAPFVKTGGLADVIGAVPKALAPLGVDVKIIIPAYPALSDLLKTGRVVLNIDDLFGGAGRLVEVFAQGLHMLLLDAPHLFDRPGNIYLDENGQDWHDNHLRFGALSKVAAMIGLDGVGSWKPDLIHAHDWQAGLAPLFIQMAGKENTPQCIMTIHNIAFQGLFHWSIKDIFAILDVYFTHEGAEYWFFKNRP
jgi:starch synthase